MDVDVWSRPEARAAATSVFRLAHDHPVLRPVSSDAAVGAAAGLGQGRGPVPRPVVEDVIAALPGEDVSRLVSLADEVAPRQWRTLVDEAGPEPAQEPLLVGVATAAISELRAPARWLVAMREGTADTAPGPLNVLASLLHPQSVWSIDEALAAQALAAPSLPLPQRLAVIVSFAEAELEPHHVERARRVAEPVRRVLPLAEAPRTSRHLADALALVRRNRSAAAELCGLLLLTYVVTIEGAVMPAPSLQ